MRAWWRCWLMCFGLRSCSGTAAPATGGGGAPVAVSGPRLVGVQHKEGATEQVGIGHEEVRRNAGGRRVCADGGRPEEVIREPERVRATNGKSVHERGVGIQGAGIGCGVPRCRSWLSAEKNANRVGSGTVPAAPMYWKVAPCPAAMLARRSCCALRNSLMNLFSKMFTSLKFRVVHALSENVPA